MSTDTVFWGLEMIISSKDICIYIYMYYDYIAVFKKYAHTYIHII